MKQAFAALALATLVSAPASAAPFTWEFTGTITTVVTSPLVGIPPPGGNPFAIGDAFKFVLTQESTALDHGSSPTCGSYSPFGNATLSDGAFSASGTPAVGGNFVHSSSWTQFNNGIDCGNLPPSANSGLAQVQGLAASGISSFFTVVFEYGGTYPTDALVTDLSNFHVFQMEFDWAFGAGGQRNNIAVGRVTGARDITAVPEPASMLLVGSGLLAAIRGRHHRATAR